MKGASTFVEAVKRSCRTEDQWIGQVVLRGPWLAKRSVGESLEVFVPVPAILQTEKSQKSMELHRLAPLPANQQLPGWDPPSDQQGLRPVWLKHLSPTEPVVGHLTAQGLVRFLGGEQLTSEDLVPPDDLFGLDYRTSIRISPDRLTAEESQIFGRGFLALKEKVFLYAEIELPNSAPDASSFDDIGTLSLGGEGRHSTLERLPRPYSWPSQEKPKGTQKPLVLLTTPCPFQAGWRPRRFNGHLKAAAVPGSLAFSGWDLARGGPKPTRFAVPAGSVYFLESLPNDWAQTLAENGEERQQGWGCCLTGVWTDD